MLRISVAPAARHEEIAEFYRVEGARGRPGSGDRVYIAELEDRIVGAVRRCEEEGVVVLRTMRIAAAHQRRGIGRRLMRALVEELAGRPCYLLGYAHLEGFYGLEGFKPVAAADLPPHLRERLGQYLQERPDYLPMLRIQRGSADRGLS